MTKSYKTPTVDDETVVIPVYNDALKIDNTYLYLNSNIKNNKSVLLISEYEIHCEVNKENKPLNNKDDIKNNDDDVQSNDDNTSETNNTLDSGNFISFSDLKKNYL